MIWKVSTLVCLPMSDVPVFMEITWESRALLLISQRQRDNCALSGLSTRHSSRRRPHRTYLKWLNRSNLGALIKTEMPAIQKAKVMRYTRQGIESVVESCELVPLELVTWKGQVRGNQKGIPYVMQCIRCGCWSFGYLWRGLK